MPWLSAVKFTSRWLFHRYDKRCSWLAKRCLSTIASLQNFWVIYKSRHVDLLQEWVNQDTLEYFFYFLFYDILKATQIVPAVIHCDTYQFWFSVIVDCTLESERKCSLGLYFSVYRGKFGHDQRLFCEVFGDNVVGRVKTRPQAHTLDHWSITLALVGDNLVEGTINV